MTKTLDLNALDQPILEVKLRDANKTTFRLTAPTTKLVERLIAAKGELVGLAKTKDEKKLNALDELTADLMSCNADYITVTTEELRDTYRVTFADIVVIFSAYLDFINELTNAKN